MDNKHIMDRLRGVVLMGAFHCIKMGLRSNTPATSDTCLAPVETVSSDTLSRLLNWPLIDKMKKEK